VLALAGSSAGAEPKPKPKPDKYARAAGEVFAQAAEAAQRNEVSKAIRLYEEALELSPHAHTAFNLAELQARDRKLRAAVLNYELYLALAPAAPDRKEIEAVIAELERRPATVLLETRSDEAPRAMDVTQAYVFIDGELVLKPGAAKPTNGVIELPVAPGRRRIDVVTALSFFTDVINLEPGHPRNRVTPKAHARIEGNVVITSLGPSARIGGDSMDRGVRLEFQPGTYALRVESQGRECVPLELSVGKNADEVKYVHLKRAEPYPLSGRCPKLAVKQHTLVFPP
jgi:hypothetical protein